ncbi:MAG: M28 family peptidase [Gemmatimonadota bacterium]|nr:MAG: M28 family peptidase [Gemmatimonadota bacterium]
MTRSTKRPVVTTLVTRTMKATLRMELKTMTEMMMTNTRRCSAAVFALLVLMAAANDEVAAQASSTVSEGGAAAAASTITVADLESHMSILAHDSMKGRDTPSPGLLATANYVADRFRDAGLQPGAGDSYLQMYPVSMVKPGPVAAQILRLQGPEGEVELAYGEDYFAFPDLGAAEGSGQLIRFDSPETLVDASGKIGVILVTQSNMRAIFSGAFRRAVEQADPAATLVVLDVPEPMFEGIRAALAGDRVSLGEAEGPERPTVLVALASLPPALAQILTEGGSLSGWSALIRTESEAQISEAPNTIGVLPGSDPQLKNEYVLFSAHMDHVGVGRPIGGDSIYNGADDNASGTVTIIELSVAFASLDARPRRSLIFLTVSGEEKGLLGSRWYAEHPEFPLEQTVANINMDMLGRNWQDTIVVIGKEESSLGEVVEGIAEEKSELNMAVIDDIWPEENFYSRSDHINFARKGVPILFFFNGTHPDYHRPSDESDKIEYDKMSRLGRLIFYLGLEVANADERPRWDPAAYDRVVEERRPRM